MRLQAKRNNTKNMEEMLATYVNITNISQFSQGGFLSSPAAMYSNRTALVPIFINTGGESRTKVNDL